MHTKEARAAIAVTLISSRAKELPMLLMAISAINVWNRLAVATHQALPDMVEG